MTVLPRFGGGLNLNVHIHALVLDGCHHATHAIHLIQRYYLMFRFGEPPEKKRP
ncbi:MAG: transposase [Acidobacteria bacterium]|nr:transposase [Acidobacteriota bacterium]